MSVPGFVEVLVWTWLIGRPGNVVKGSKGKKCYFSIFTHALDIALVNAHAIYNLMHESK